MNVQATNHRNTEINIDDVISVLAGLSAKIWRLRGEIDVFKSGNKIYPPMARSCSRRPPSEFNDPTKNGKRRTTGARYELQRNFKGNDSPGGTDLSARSSFAKRAREVKAANEVAVFKEDYLHDDKSIEDDERPNRSRVSELSGTYRKSISVVEKFRKEADERSDDVRDNAGIASADVGEKLRKSSGYQDNRANDGNSSPGDVIATKIKRKRISRGVQYDDISGRRKRIGCSFLNCFKLRSRNAKKHKLTREVKKKRASVVEKEVDIAIHETQTEVNESLAEEIISHDTESAKSRNAIKNGEKLMSNADSRKEKSESDEGVVRKIVDTNDDKKRKEDSDSKEDKTKINRLRKSWLNKIINVF